jgi:hypothetical protein
LGTRHRKKKTSQKKTPTEKQKDEQHWPHHKTYIKHSLCGNVHNMCKTYVPVTHVEHM